MMAMPGTRWVSLFTRADTWALLSGRDATCFTDRFFDPLLLAESLTASQRLPALLDFRCATESSHDVVARDLILIACEGLSQAARRQGTHLLDQALEELGHHNLS
jgi:hypothetical protein